MAKEIKEEKITRNIQIVEINNPRTVNKKTTWINITNAGKREIEFLRKQFNFQLPHLHASSANVFAQRPVIQHTDDYIFVILQFPIYLNGTVTSTEVDIFLKHGYMVTIHNGNLTALNDFFSRCKKDGDSLLTFQFESTAVLLYELLEKLMISCYPLLDENSLAINKVEEVIFSQDQRQAVSNILTLRHNIVSFHKIMHSHKKIITKFMELKSRLIPAEQLKGYYKNLIEHSINIWEILESQKDIVEILNSTNQSLMNNKLNDTMKFLTIFSLISFYLTLFVAIFGVHAVDTPFIDSPGGFWILLTMMMVVALSIILVFRRKKWL
ncbi:MAG: magnesium transporter CorA family protein [Candidatus Falkowbacteria bacterium]